MDADYISEDEFWEDWGLIQKVDGEFFDYEDLRRAPVHNVWTVVESGTDNNDNWYASPGFHIVNKLGYVLTERPWHDDRRDAIYLSISRD